MQDTIEIDVLPILRERLSLLDVQVVIESDGSEWISLDVLANRIAATSVIDLDVPQIGDADAA